MSRRKDIPAAGYHRRSTTVFLRGRQQRRYVEYMDGIPLHDWLSNNRDPITLWQDGEYEQLDALYAGQTAPWAQHATLPDREGVFGPAELTGLTEPTEQDHTYE